MISGINMIWIRFEMKSQKTKAIGGSNCSRSGARKFQASQNADQTKMMKKNPIVPTRSVTQMASLFHEAEVIAHLPVNIAQRRPVLPQLGQRRWRGNRRC